MADAADPRPIVPATTPHAAPQERTPPGSPVRVIPGEVVEPKPGIALCLSGGGYRAMLFHLGALVRLNELGYLPKLDRISSVSGGSITAGVLAKAWADLSFDASGVAKNFSDLVVRPVSEIAAKEIDYPAIARGLWPLGTHGSQLARFYEPFFGHMTLQQLPERPEFMFDSTSLQSGVLWLFCRKYMGDYRVGHIASPDVELAVAVAASSAFPPFLSPLVMDLGGHEFDKGSGGDLATTEYRKRAVLTDGGVYDNLGIEPAWKRFQTILVSDGAARTGSEPDPHFDWALQAYRVLMVIDAQVGSLRKAQVIDSYQAPPADSNHRDGTYWGIASHIADYGLDPHLDCPPEATAKLAAYPTRLTTVDPTSLSRLINWGYAICDVAMRKHVVQSAGEGSFPFPKVGVGD